MASNRLVAALVLTGLISAGAGAQGVKPSGEALYAIAEGRWAIALDTPDGAETECESHPIRIEIDSDRARYSATYYSAGSMDKYEVAADILGAGPGWFHIAYDGEERLDDFGQPQTWYWVMVDENAFVWVRNDWVDAGGSTAMRVRCEGAVSS